MEEPILQIQQKKYSGESTVVSIRVPKDMVRMIDEVAQISGRTRNEIMTMGLEFALNHMVVTSAVKTVDTKMQNNVTAESE